MGPLEIKFLVILGILIGLTQAKEVVCYECDESDRYCNDPFKASGVGTTRCAGTCFKYKREPYKPAANRGCQIKHGSGANGCIEGTYDEISGLMCACQGNFCNYALPVGSSIMVTAAAMIINIVLR